MPSSRARRRRAQQRRGPGPQQAASRRRPESSPATPVTEPEDVLASAAPEERGTAAGEPEEVLDAEVRRPVDDAPATAGDEAHVDEAEDEDDLEPDEDLEAQEEDIAAAELQGEDEEDEEDEGDDDDDEDEADEEDDEGPEDLDGERSPTPGRRAPSRTAAAVAERPRTQPRSQNRNRRRAATPQPQGPALVRFFRETFDELRKVDWPNGSELYRYTLIVIITVIVLAAFISGIDWGLQQLAQKFVYGPSSGVTG